MLGILSALIILASVLLIFVVFIQNPKGGGLSSEFGSASQLGGVQKTNEFIDKATWVLAGSILVLSVSLTIMQPPSEAEIQREQLEQMQKQQQQQQKGQPTPTGQQPAGN